MRMERIQVTKDSQGREGQTHESRADQGDVRTKELGYVTRAPCAA
jgi:hypothetical protein